MKGKAWMTLALTAALAATAPAAEARHDVAESRGHGAPSHHQSARARGHHGRDHRRHDRHRDRRHGHRGRDLHHGHLAWETYRRPYAPYVEDEYWLRRLHEHDRRWVDCAFRLTPHRHLVSGGRIVIQLGW